MKVFLRLRSRLSSPPHSRYSKTGSQNSNKNGFKIPLAGLKPNLTYRLMNKAPSAAPPISAPARSFRSARNIATTQANGRNIPNDGSGQPRPQDSPMNMNRNKPAVSTDRKSTRLNSSHLG